MNDMSKQRLSLDYVGYRDAAAAILSRQAGAQAVATFGLSDVFHESDLRPAYAFLEAQGRHGATTPALGMLALTHLGLPEDDSFGIPFGRDSLVAVTGGEAFEAVVVIVDQPGTGLVALDVPAAESLADKRADDYLRVLDSHSTPRRLLVPEPDVAPHRTGLLAKLQLGISAELLGVSSRLLEDAIAYAKTRRQFGQPIGDFQAVQHLLAWAATDLHQLQCLFDIAVRQSARENDPALARVVKATAGRTFHSIVQTATQVTGAISFTWEYSLNQLHHRGLSLDQMAGPSGDLVAEIGREIRVSGVVPVLHELSDFVV